MSGLPDYGDALAAALRAVEPLAAAERVRLEHACGRALAQAVVADRHLPPFNRAQMDGYALRAREFVAGRAWPVVAEVPAGAPGEVAVPPGSCVAIATGAPLPPEVDTVIEHELSDRRNPVRFRIESVQAGRSVHPRGADAARGAVLVTPGTVLGPQHVGIAAAVGHGQLQVRVRPRAAVLTSGDEVVHADGSIAPHQIRNSNGPMIEALLRRMGAETVAGSHVRDERAATVAAVERTIDACDLLISIGGVSAGERDHFRPAFESAGVRPSLEGAAIQPGRPIFVGHTERGGAARLVVGLPGNPVSALACACLFAWPIVLRLLGVEAPLPWRRTPLAAPVRPNARRRAFRPALALEDGSARVPAWAGSGDLAHTAPTHGLLELPLQEGEVPAGTLLRFLPWPCA